jgi:hypothetical protein
MYLSFYTVLCFTLVFFEVFSEFLYLSLCYVIFFVFGVMKFWGRLMVIRLVIDYLELVNVALKKGGWEKGWICGLKVMGIAGFCGPCVCLGIFLLLQWRVFVSVISGACGCVQLIE